MFTFVELFIAVFIAVNILKTRTCYCNVFCDTNITHHKGTDNICVAFN
jgi:hypothetical protein